jgi:glycosyltransferase involved in cell wall biosynthesis
VIGIYCHHTSVFAHNSGIQRCVRATATAIHNLGNKITPLVWDNQLNSFAIAGKLAREHLSVWGGPSPDNWDLKFPPKGSWLIVIELISGPHQPSQSNLRAKADQFGWNLMAVFHDDIPLGWGEAPARFHSEYMHGLAKYERVLATSTVSKNAIITFWRKYRVSPLCKNVDIVSLAVQIPGQRRRFPSSFASSYPLNILCVGSLEKRKNHLAVLKAMTWLNAYSVCCFNLVLAGWPNDPEVLAYIKRAQSIGLSLEYEGSVSDERLVVLYEQADLTIYPSLSEGFGLPVLESCWFGKPCISSFVPCLSDQEIALGCLVLDKLDWLSISHALLKIYLDPYLLADLKSQIFSMRLKSWPQYGRDILNIICMAKRNDFF